MGDRAAKEPLGSGPILQIGPSRAVPDTISGFSSPPQDANASCRREGINVAISDIAARTNTRSLWRTCLVCDALDNLPAAEATALRSLLGNPGVRYTELSQALQADEDYPLDLPPDTLSRHARGQCSAREKLRGASA